MVLVFLGAVALIPSDVKRSVWHQAVEQASLADAVDVARVVAAEEGGQVAVKGVHHLGRCRSTLAACHLVHNVEAVLEPVEPSSACCKAADPHLVGQL